MTRKSIDRTAAKGDVPAVPSPTATYPVEGTSATGHAVNASNNDTSATNARTTTDRDGTRLARTTDRDVDNLSRDMERTSMAGTYDPKNFTSTPFDQATFFGNTTTTTTHESTQKPAVVQEVVKKHVHEIVTPVFHNEHHVVHHQTRIQPVLEQVMLPPKHYVLIDGQKHEILPEAVMNHIVVARDWIPMNVKPEVIVHQYVGNEPLLGPLTGTGASLINKDVMLEHQRKINTSYESKVSGQRHEIPTGNITHVNYTPNQVPVSLEHGTGSSAIATTANPVSTGTRVATS